MTPTFTFTASPTLTPTHTFTAYWTSTPTQTQVPNKKPCVYPNPSDGTSPARVLPPAYTGLSPVKVQIFTLAFRKVLEKNYPPMAWGLVSVPLVDAWNKPLASGVYYVVIQTAQGRSIAKLLILR